MKTAGLGTDLVRTWQDIARDIEQERSPIRIRILARELNDMMLSEERMRVVQRLRTVRSPERVGE
jgi:hypothetical protein